MKFFYLSLFIALIVTLSGCDSKEEEQRIVIPLPATSEGGIKIESDAIIYENRRDWLLSLIDPAVGLIKGNGWVCDSVSAVQADSSTHFVVRCNRFKYVYDFNDHGGKWSVSVN